ncbi:MAG: ABC transporter permease [Myxococcales bacterium]|nr:ABC transporter permease [Myxococcales bacterium]
MNALLAFIAQVLTVTPPLLFAALGGVVSERAGVATVALEGYLLGGAFTAVVLSLATHSVALGLLATLAAGAAMGLVFALCVVGLRAQPIVAGVAFNVLMASLTRVLLKVLYDSASNSPALATVTRAGASTGVASLVDAMAQPTLWLAPVAVLGLGWMFRDTVLGLRITAVGEHPRAAQTRGVSLSRVRTEALVLGAMVAALGGAALGLHQRQFLAYMSGGRGFLALAAVILGRWEPRRAALWAVALGALQALEASLEGVVPVPSALLQAMPFALTLLVVSGKLGRARAPAALGSSGEG